MDTRKLFITYALLAGVAAALFALSLPVFAQTDTADVRAQNAQRAASTTPGTLRRDDIPALREARMEAVEEKRRAVAARRAEAQAALAADMQERVERIATQAANRLSAAIDRLTTLADRISAHIDTLEENGADMTAAKRHVEDARTSIAAAQVALSSIEVEVDYVITSEQPRVDWQDLRALLVEAQRHLIDARNSLREAVVLITTARAADTEAE